MKNRTWINFRLEHTGDRYNVVLQCSHDHIQVHFDDLAIVSYSMNACMYERSSFLALKVLLPNRKSAPVYRVCVRVRDITMRMLIALYEKQKHSIEHFSFRCCCNIYYWQILNDWQQKRSAYVVDPTIGLAIVSLCTQICTVYFVDNQMLAFIWPIIPRWLHYSNPLPNNANT